MERRLHPLGRGCVDCGRILSRHGKWRCKECHRKYQRTLVGKRNHQYKGENASKVAINRVIINRIGKARICSNANCDGYSTTYKWVRLKAKSGRRGGIWVSLCNKCRSRLQEAYPIFSKHKEVMV